VDVDYARAVTAQIELRAGNVALARTLIEQNPSDTRAAAAAGAHAGGLGVAAALGDRDALEHLLDPELAESAQTRGTRSG